MTPRWLEKYRRFCESKDPKISLQDITECENRVRDTPLTETEAALSLEEADMKLTGLAFPLPYLAEVKEDENRNG